MIVCTVLSPTKSTDVIMDGDVKQDTHQVVRQKRARSLKMSGNLRPIPIGWLDSFVRRLHADKVIATNIDPRVISSEGEVFALHKHLGPLRCESVPPVVEMGVPNRQGNGAGSWGGRNARADNFLSTVYPRQRAGVA